MFNREFAREAAIFHDLKPTEENFKKVATDPRFKKEYESLFYFDET